MGLSPRHAADKKRTTALGVLSLSRDMDFLTRAAERVADCRLIVIDPVSAYLDGTNESDDTDRLTEARDFLTQFLAAGPQPTVALTEAARTHRIGKPSLWSAKRELSILAFRGTGPNNHRWFWKLPDLLGNPADA